MQIFNKNHVFFHQAILFLLVLIVAGIQTLFLTNINSQIFFFLTITLTIGIFHGMLDILLLSTPPYKRVGFLISYVALAMSALLFFLYVPHTALIALLIVSVWHFGEAQQSDDSEQIKSKLQHFFKRFLLGGSVLAAPYILANQSLNEILIILLPAATWFSITRYVWAVIAWLWLAIFIVYFMQLVLYKTFKFANVTLLEILVVWFAFSLLSPLIAFSLYFGAYHAVRHIRDVLNKTNAMSNKKASLIWVAIITLCILILITLVLNNKINLQGLQGITPAILLNASVILLVTITLPHSFLTSYWRYNYHKSL